MERLNAYSSKSPDGKGISIDVEGMLVDLITVLKAAGCLKFEAVAMFGKTWEEVKVEVNLPRAAKDKMT